jgi:hypothetical protein
MEERLALAQHQRRAEDLIRDEYHDSRAIIVTWSRKNSRRPGGGDKSFSS